jgi:DsbC/DsbD-like thiol-disulfide interchange protein
VQNINSANDIASKFAAAATPSIRGGVFVGVCALLLHPHGAFAGDAVVQTPQTRAELSAERRVASPGESLWVALSIDLKPKWHTYWRNPGDAGQPIVITWKLPAGVVAGPIQWPTPESFGYSGITGFGYTGHVTLLTELKIASSIAAPTEILLKADGAWLICSEICVPEDGSFSLPIKIDPMHRNTVANAAFTAARDAVPRPAPWPVKATRSGNTLTITAGPGISEQALKSVLYFPYDGNLIANGTKQDFRLQDGTLKLKVELMPDASKRGDAAGVLRFDREHSPVPTGYSFAAPIL